MLSTILAIIKAITAIKSMFEQLMALYVQSEIASMKKENVVALRKALNEHDQRDLEKALGNPNPGTSSGDSGAVIITDPKFLRK